MQIHHTKGIVLRTVKYGDTSVITTVYTELFGVQSYIVKGVRQSSKKSQGKAGYFQPAAILDLQVYHNELKNLQFIKEFQWAVLYKNVLTDVIRNAVALYIVELLQHSIKQPEANPELFYITEEALLQIDDCSAATLANMPLYYSLQLAAELGFRMQGQYSAQTPFFDLQEGCFVPQAPQHPQYLQDEQAAFTSQIVNAGNITALGHLLLNRNTRRALLHSFKNYFALHIADFGDLRSLTILQEVLS
ncbi:MAG: DNA repair protein RecO [Bacteroidota bacterium]|nr:DNA repair protein RecO [Bacteroidota bacterium]